jgi:hypothetical protein
VTEMLRWFITVPELSGVRCEIFQSRNEDEAKSAATAFALDWGCAIAAVQIAESYWHWFPGSSKCTWKRMVVVPKSTTPKPSVKSIGRVSRLNHWLAHTLTGKCKNRICIWGDEFNKSVDTSADRLWAPNGWLELSLIYDESSADFPAPDVLAAWLDDRDEYILAALAARWSVEDLDRLQ